MIVTKNFATDMKKFVFTIFCCLLLTTAIAGTKVRSNDSHISAVEKKYAIAKQFIAMGEEEEMARNMATLNIDQMWPGTGRHKEQLTFYFDLADGEEGAFNALYLAKHTYNAAVREYELEYLFNGFGQLLKCTAKGPEGTCTYYFEKGEFYKSVPAKAPAEFFTSAEGILKEAERIHSIFKAAIKLEH